MQARELVLFAGPPRHKEGERWWALLVLIGALPPLLYLQLTGFISEWDDGNPPLGEIQVLRLALLVFPILLGMGLGEVWDEIRRIRRRGSGPRPLP